MKYIMFEHAGSGNHGCEAIVRSTTDMLGKNDYYLQTLYPKEDIEFGLDKIASLIDLDGKKKSVSKSRNISMRIQSRLNPKIGYDERESLFRNKELLLNNSVALSIGGDNYCYRGIVDSMRDKMTSFNIKKIPAVLWGCSVDSTYLDEPTIADLKSYKLITARESLTVEVLDSIGVRDTVVECADPAFTLKRQAVDWNNDLMAAGNIIGINVSDFMRYYNAYPNATYNNFYKLITHIINKTDCYIAMIPHVRQEGNDDLIPIRKIAEAINSDRIFVVDQRYNCMQLKDIIARCRVFIGCRTHSTIAAYSSCVPTLVVGYSIKAKGICKDLFGREDGLLVDVREFKTDNDLTNIFGSFMEQESELREHLNRIMPQYKDKAYLASKALSSKFQ